MDDHSSEPDALSVFTTSAAHAVLVMYACHFALLHRVDERSVDVLREAFPGRFSGGGDAVMLEQLADAADGLLPAFERSGYLEAYPQSLPQPMPAWRVPEHAHAFLMQQLTRYETPVEGGSAPGDCILAALRTLTRDTAEGERFTGELAMQLRSREEWAELEVLWCRLGMRLIIVDPDAAFAAYGALPEQALAGHPGLRLAHLYLQVTSVMHGLRPGASDENADVLVARLSLQVTEATSSIGPLWREFESADMRLHIGLNWMRFQRLSGDFEGALATRAELQRFFIEDVTAAQTVSDRNRAFFKLEQGILFFFVERWAEALDSLRDAVLLWQRPGYGDYIPAFALALSGMIHVLRGSRDFAAECLENAQRIFGEVWDFSYISVLTVTVEAQLALDRVDLARALELLELVSDTAPESELWPIVALVRQRADLLAGDAEEAALRPTRIGDRATGAGRLSPLAQRLLRRMRVDGFLALGQAQHARAFLQRSTGQQRGAHEGWARLLLMAGRHVEVLQHIDAVLSDDRMNGRDRLSLLLFEAAAHLALGDEAEADRAVSAAVATMRHACTLVPLALLPRRIRSEVVERCARTPEWAAILRELRLEPGEALLRLAAFGDGFPETALLVDLTSREAELLALLDERVTQTEIAARLHLALSTVKKRVSGLYRKLGVESQAEALRQAYRLGLLGA